VEIALHDGQCFVVDHKGVRCQLEHISEADLIKTVISYIKNPERSHEVYDYLQRLMLNSLKSIKIAHEEEDMIREFFKFPKNLKRKYEYHRNLLNEVMKDVFDDRDSQKKKFESDRSEFITDIDKLQNNLTRMSKDLEEKKRIIVRMKKETQDAPQSKIVSQENHQLKQQCTQNEQRLRELDQNISGQQNLLKKKEIEYQENMGMLRAEQIILSKQIESQTEKLDHSEKEVIRINKQLDDARAQSKICEEKLGNLDISHQQKSKELEDAKIELMEIKKKMAEMKSYFNSGKERFA